jgi:hypothetical protein
MLRVLSSFHDSVIIRLTLNTVNAHMVFLPYALSESNTNAEDIRRMFRCIQVRRFE